MEIVKKYSYRTKEDFLKIYLYKRIFGSLKKRNINITVINYGHIVLKEEGGKL